LKFILPLRLFGDKDFHHAKAQRKIEQPTALLSKKLSVSLCENKKYF